MASVIPSLSVPNVQELADAINSGTCEFPDRYIRPEAADSDPVVDNIGNDVLPIIDLERLRNPRRCKEERAKLDLACKEWGFFQADQKLDWEDMLLLATQPPTKRDMKYCPTGPPTFKLVMDTQGMSYRLQTSHWHLLEK
ncbi:uncharacterized protein A4U43_C02F3070 [Asparagus officinalis]|uniref:Non-haem dioxygenase N-terminal domain-containing protein n=1 Tax=Asparagus officinalis TaxID=4686 RepID=A0A5P1FI58_ASPOF|nr:uncharacterized protein A4U43_C02F3070 [Asparagus officinalis]